MRLCDIELAGSSQTFLDPGLTLAFEALQQTALQCICAAFFVSIVPFSALNAAVFLAPAEHIGVREIGTELRVEGRCALQRCAPA